MNTIGFNNQQVQRHAEPWETKYDPAATIFGTQTYVPIDFQHAQNDNVLVLGSSGTGKTYSFVEPNVLQANANYVIADAKGDILADVGESLRKQGYKIQVLNLIDLRHSLTYNPLTYLNTELSVTSFASQVLSSDVNGRVATSLKDDPFWHNGPAVILQALILWVKEFLPAEEQNMATVCRIFNMLDQPDTEINEILQSLSPDQLLVAYTFDHETEIGYDGTEVDKVVTIGERLFEMVQEKSPQSSALRAWQSIKGTKDSSKTWASLVGILGAALAPYQIDEVARLMASNQIDFSTLLKPKTALFILYDDADSSKNFISNTLYSQLFAYLYHEAFKRKDKKLPIKVRFFLDDFKNVQIPHFDDYLATTRSRNISVCMMLQDESQLQTKFGSNTPSVIGNCSAYLLTGTMDLGMARTAADRFNQPAQEIRLIPAEEFLLDLGGHLTVARRYDFHDHPNYVPKLYHLNVHFRTPKALNDWKGLRNVLENLPDEDVEYDLSDMPECDFTEEDLPY